MSTELEKAKAVLSQGYTCVLCGDEQVYTSRKRGVAPLLELLHSDRKLRGFSAADKVVGRATAFLYCLLEVREVYGAVMSIPARQVLCSYGIQASYDRLVEGIRNRDNTGPCPMEHATRELDDPSQALQAIEKALEQLRSQA